MKQFISERIDENGNVYHKYKVNKGEVEEFIKKNLTQEEKDQINDFNRIEELKEIISNKKLLDIQCTDEQDELRTLLGL